MNVDEAVIYCQKELLDGHFLKKTVYDAIFGEDAFFNHPFLCYIPLRRGVVTRNSVPLKSEVMFGPGVLEDMIEMNRFPSAWADMISKPLLGSLEELILCGDTDSADTFLATFDGVVKRSQRKRFNVANLNKQKAYWYNPNSFWCSEDCKLASPCKYFDAHSAENFVPCHNIPENFVICFSEMPETASTLPTGFDGLELNIAKHIECNLVAKKDEEGEDVVSALLTTNVFYHAGRGQRRGRPTRFTLLEIYRERMVQV